jgi:signal transduction histidine kinase
LRQTADDVHFVVSDSGRGISSEDHTKLFSAFSQVESGSTRGKEGTGLGLYLSALLAKALGGRLSLQSALGEGSHFGFHLPR